MNTKKWDDRFLVLAKLIGSWSKDPSTKVGAVIVDDKKRIVSVGYNGFPRGVEDSEKRLCNRQEKYDIIVHAEVNAIAFANKSVEGCTLYIDPFEPCSRCAGIIIQNGIKRVVSYKNKNDRWEKDFSISRKLLTEAGLIVDYYDV